MKARAYCLAIGAAVYAVATAAPPAPTPPTPAARQPDSVPGNSAPPPQQSAPPEESLIEFLGADDVGDAGWWDYFNHTEPRAQAAPTQDPSQ